MVAEVQLCTFTAIRQYRIQDQDKDTIAAPTWDQQDCSYRPGSHLCLLELKQPWLRCAYVCIVVRSRSSSLSWNTCIIPSSFLPPFLPSHIHTQSYVCMSRAFRRLSETSRHLSSAIASTTSPSSINMAAAEYSTRVIGAPNTFGEVLSQGAMSKAWALTAALLNTRTPYLPRGQGYWNPPLAFPRHPAMGQRAEGEREQARHRHIILHFHNGEEVGWSIGAMGYPLVYQWTVLMCHSITPRRPSSTWSSKFLDGPTQRWKSQRRKP